MTTLSSDEFEAFIVAARAEGGRPVVQLTRQLEALFATDRSERDVNDYRLAQRRWKKIRDEVAPSLRLFSRIAPSARIRFPMDSNPPDAWIWLDEEADPTAVELTVSQGRARRQLAETLIEDGIGPGFLGLSDSAGDEAFAAAKKRGRAMYTADGAMASVERAVRDSLRKKDRPKYEGYILIVTANFSPLAEERWLPLVGRLSAQAEAMPFVSIYVVPDRDDRDWHLQLK